MRIRLEKGDQFAARGDGGPQGSGSIVVEDPVQIAQFRDHASRLKTQQRAGQGGGQVWLCDFGMARQFCNDKGEEGTGYMFTRWYRAPEVFLPRWIHDQGRHVVVGVHA